MRLAEWRKREGLTLEQCAVRFGAANGKVVQRWESGESVPRRPAMQRIYAATEGAVDANDFNDLPAAESSTPSAGLAA